MQKILKAYFLFTILLCPFFTSAQGISQTPYSQFGLGDLELFANARMMAMGGTGVSMIQPSSINFKNPAALAYNRKYVIFEAGFYGQNLSINTATQSERVANGNIQYFAFAAPLNSKYYTIALGLTPFSYGNSKFISSNNIPPFDSVNTNVYTTQGGLSQVFLTNSFKLPKGFSVGLTSSFVFGTYNRNFTSYINDLSPYTTSQIKSKETYRYVDFKLGLTYITKLTSRLNLTLGATMTFNKCLSAQNTSSVSINSIRTGNSILIPDTTVTNISNPSLPKVFTFGFSLDRSNSWNAGFDYMYTGYASNSGIPYSQFYSYGHRFSLGGEFVPKFNTLRGYLLRMVYRGGAFFNSTPLTINGQRIIDYGASFGFGLPLAKSHLGAINISIMIGQRGTTSFGLIQENYIRLFLGFNINDLWFVRHKID